MSRRCKVPSPKLPSRTTARARNDPAASSGTVMRPSTRGAATGPSTVASNRAIPVSGQVIPGAAGDRDQAGLPTSPAEHGEPGRGRSQLAGQLGLVPLPPESHAPGGQLSRAERAVGTDPLDALARCGRLEAEAGGCHGKGERVGLRPAIDVEPVDLDHPRGLGIPVEDMALPDLHHAEPRRHRADGDGVGWDRDRQSAAAPRGRDGHLDARQGHADHESPMPEAFEPDADVPVVELEQGPVLPGSPARDGHPRDSEGDRPGAEGHGADAGRAAECRDQRALELGADQLWPAKPEQNPRRRDARSEEQDERRKPDETPPDETTPRKAQPGSAGFVHRARSSGIMTASLEESTGMPAHQAARHSRAPEETGRGLCLRFVPVVVSLRSMRSRTNAGALLPPHPASTGGRRTCRLSTDQATQDVPSDGVRSGSPGPIRTGGGPDPGLLDCEGPRIGARSPTFRS